ncbi:MAG: hypothetical protein NZ893_01760 [Candidatus Aenigmarchaeota archaeon]|nr:hypothetical protein [Candidatus Aenigmarchaeota archaeon]
MAEEALKVLKMDQNRFVEEHTDPKLIKFLELHSSWKNVAEAEIKKMYEIIREG